MSGAPEPPDARAIDTEILGRLADTVTAMLAYWDADQRCRFANRAYQRWFNRNPEDLIGRTLEDLLGPIYPKNLPYIEGALRGEYQVFEREIPDPHGGPPRYSQAEYVPDIVDGVVRGFAVLVTDITGRRRAEDAFRAATAERMTAMTTLASGIAHEINNPLAVTLANLESIEQELEGTAVAPIVRERLTDARSGAERVASIVESMKLLSHVETRKKERVDVAKALEESLRLVDSALRYRAQVTTEIPDVGAVMATTADLSRAFVNLLLNAAESLSEGRDARSEIRVTATREGELVRVAIADTGRGIPVDHHAHVFDPFFTTKPVGLGTGLGLTTAAHVVRGLGGRITFESAVGEGSTFFIDLPAAERPREVPAAAAPAAATSPSPSTRVRVLVIDDEPTMTTALRRVLEREFEVEVFTSGRLALARLLDASAPRPSVVLCDVTMPDVDGPRVYADTTARHPELSDRFVFMTGGAYTRSAREFLESCGRPLVSKPFNLPTLLDTVRRAHGAA